MKRHAPKAGYDFTVKEKSYRRKVYRWIDAELKNKVPKRRRNVVFLDTREALEAICLLRSGYCPDRLHAVNINPADVALLTMKLDKLGLPRIHTHGINFTRTLAEARVDHWHVMSFDGCGPISSNNSLRCISEMSRFASAGSIVVATLLAGRESGDHSRRLSEYRQTHKSSNAHEQRYQWLRRLFSFDLVDGHAKQLWTIVSERRGYYMSTSRQPMLWLAARLGPVLRSFDIGFPNKLKSFRSAEYHESIRLISELRESLSSSYTAEFKQFLTQRE